ncbi:MAG: hypothetical protein IT210_00065 [Armatimonadetes bacterium]|nr:hypothetical protein [Armatimonadota bacterium]
MYLALNDPARSKASLRRSVVLDPSLDDAWRALAAFLSQEEDFDDLAAIYEERLHHEDTV